MQIILSIFIILVIIGSVVLIKKTYENTKFEDFIEHLFFILVADVFFVSILWNVWQ